MVKFYAIRYIRSVLYGDASNDSLYWNDTSDTFQSWPSFYSSLADAERALVRTSCKGSPRLQIVELVPTPIFTATQTGVSHDPWTE